jgi:Uma2 family endonuclease
MAVVTKKLRWTATLVQQYYPQPLDDTRYEVIDGDLYVSTQPSASHQFTTGEVFGELRSWGQTSRQGVALLAPGLIFSEDNNAAPDVVWLSNTRLQEILGEDGKLHGAPELVVEVVSPGEKNERRDREAKLFLYSRHGVDEYWIIDPQAQSVDVFRRQPDAPLLRHSVTWKQGELMESPLLPGFRVPVGQLFLPLRPERPKAHKPQ